ncbi:hypothetical protein GCM10022205_04430 [Spinactinospora alkalitolerans]
MAATGGFDRFLEGRVVGDDGEKSGKAHITRWGVRSWTDSAAGGTRGTGSVGSPLLAYVAPGTGDTRIPPVPAVDDRRGRPPRPTSGDRGLFPERPHRPFPDAF